MFGNEELNRVYFHLPKAKFKSVGDRKVAYQFTRAETASGEIQIL